MPKRQYILYCDESAKTGAHFSNFYGGVLLEASDREAVEAALEAKKIELNLFGELKWTKVTENYLQKYMDFIDLFFDFIDASRVKVRIMFTHNYHRARGLSEQQLEDRYFILYYQLIKHAFGLSYSNPGNVDEVGVAVLLDDLPDTKEKVDIFRRHISNISTTDIFRGRNISFPYDAIAPVRSHEHNILQGLDIILGSMQFRLNDQHLAKPEGQARRGRRTLAKEKLYKHISRRIRRIYPNFNIGSSTGHGGDRASRWLHPYRHWLFVPKDWEPDRTAIKK